MSELESLAYSIKELLEKNDVFHDVRIYFEGKCLCSSEGLIENIVASKYFSYANDNTISMSFEGVFNHIINGHYGPDKVAKEFEKLINKSGYYSEFGDHWNLSLYK
jgi:hypothetical protein